MPIRFYLQPNTMIPNSQEQFARIAANNTLTADDIVKSALLRGTTLTETDLNAVMNLLFTVIADEVASGNVVLLPLVNIRPSISGTFKTITDSFDSARHTKNASISPGVMLNLKMQDAKTEKISTSNVAPTLLEFKDIESGSVNHMFTEGGIGQIVGNDLKFNPSNPEEGIFLVSREASTETRITILATYTKGKLMFRIPGNMATGHYLLEVRKGYGNANSIRKGILNHVLELI